MAIPATNQIIRDPGLGVAAPASLVPIFYGTASLGARNELVLYQSPDALKQARGSGPAVDDALYTLTQIGGPVGFMRADTTIAATNGTVSQTAAGPLPVITADALFDAFVRIQITKAGALGVAEFRYCLDGDSTDIDSTRTWSAVQVVPSGGAFTLTGLGVVVTFQAGTHELDEEYTFDANCAAWNAADLAVASTALQADDTPWRFMVAVTSFLNTDAAAHATLGAALQTHMNTLTTLDRYRRAQIQATQEVAEVNADIKTAWENVVADRLLVAHGRAKRPTADTFPGYAVPVKYNVGFFAARAAGSVPSTDLKRVQGNGIQDGGPLPVITKLFEDELKTPTGLDDISISTLRTWEALQGFFVTQGHLKSAEGSDFDKWPRGILMDIACETVAAETKLWIGSSFRFESAEDPAAGIPVGAIDIRDAKRLEGRAEAKLKAQLTDPQNAEGTGGLVQAIRVAVLRTNNAQATGQLFVEVGIKPVGYVDFVTTTLGFTTGL